MTRNGRIMVSAVIGSVLLLAAGGAWIAGRASADAFAACRKGVAAGGLDSFGGPFTLTDENGRRVTDRDVLTRPTLLYFGYTFCPTICPTDAARNGVAVDLLTDRGIETQAVFVTVDPRRDTPEVLRDFTDAMHPAMIGLTGTDDEIASVNKAWRNFYRIADNTGDPNYLVDHMTNTYLVMPGHGTVDFFNRDATAEQIADSTACFAKAAARG